MTRLTRTSNINTAKFQDIFSTLLHCGLQRKQAINIFFQINVGPESRGGGKYYDIGLSKI